MKPFIKKTFAPEKGLQWPEMGPPHECWMFFKLYFFILDFLFFSKHTFDSIEFADPIALRSFHGPCYGMVENYFRRELPDMGPLLVLSISGFLSLGKPLSLWGGPHFFIHWSWIQEVALNDLQLFLSALASWFQEIVTDSQCDTFKAMGAHGTF